MVTPTLGNQIDDQLTGREKNRLKGRHRAQKMGQVDSNVGRWRAWSMNHVDGLGLGWGWVALHLGLTHFGRPAQQTNNQTNKQSKQSKKKNPGAGPRIPRPENSVKITKATVTPHKNRQKKRSQGVKLGCQCCLHLGGNKVAFIGLTTEHKSRTNVGAIIMNEFSVPPLLWALFATNVFKPWTWAWKVWKLIWNI